MPWQCGLQASPIPEELEEVIAIGVCDTSRQHRGQGAGGGGWGLGVGFPEPNPAEVLTAHPHPPAPAPRNHASLEVLNTALYTSPKLRSTQTHWRAAGCLCWPSSASRRISSSPLGCTLTL